MANLKLEVLFNAVDKLTGPMKTIVGGSKTLSDAFKKTSAELKALEAQQRKVTGFRQLQEQSEKTSQAIQKNKETIKQLKTAMNIGAPTEQMVKELARAEAAQKRLKDAQKKQGTEMTALVRELNQTGISIDRLADDESELKNKIHLTTMEINKQKDSLERHQKAQKQYEQMQSRMAKASDLAKKGLMVAGAGAAAMAIPVHLAIDYESAMADVKKVVNFDTPQQFKIMGDDIIRLSTKLPMAAKDIAAIVAAGGQSGIAKNELLGFAESAVKMGVAFDITAQESGQAMAEMRTAFKMTQPQVVDLADKINYLGNNTPAAAKGIMDIVQRIGPLGEVGGFASGSIAALGATIRGMGVAEEVAATGIKNMMLALVAGESATKSQKAAYKALGLDAGQVAKDMQTDAEATTLKVIKSISKLDKYKQAAALKELFGSESLGSIAPLLTNMDALEKNLGMVADKSKYAGSMQAEYAARAETTANNIQLAKNQMAGLAITIGNVLLPPINTMLGKFNAIMTIVQAWAARNPALASTLVKIAVAGIAIIAIVSALALGIVGLLGPIAMLKMTISTLGIGFGALGAIFSPVGLVVIGVIAAIAGAAYLIYKNWEPIKGFFSGIWTSIKTAFNGGILGVSALIINWSPIGLFYSAFAKVLSWFGIDLPAKFTDFGAMILIGLKNGILSKVNAVKDAITGAVSGVIEKAKGVLGIHSPSRVFMGIGDYTMQGMAMGIAQNHNLPVKATQQATQNVVGTGATVKTTPVTPIRSQRAASFISQDTIQITIKAEHGQPVRETARALRAELQRIQQEEVEARRRFLTDTE
ncbi:MULTISPECIES: phage tail tape measure protein [Acinetobacter]|uniref:phage tail tape measure protein n=1 Tax=Acinetobacter TaxID=469 RepID=UPI000F66B606|nr:MULTISPECIES: phage tail tape measure protein [Acinetobacter]RSC23242.1 phage tail tape measure protein [Acinetobacter sp. FDAARGOS_515]VTX86014.1 Phage-related minor tail protein [Acinetobacter ursingii]